MNIVIAILIFSLIVIIHELGHFSLARANKIDVIEFSLGMGPRIVSWVKTDSGMKVRWFKSTVQMEEEEAFKGHTWYSLKIFPFGGSCIMLGEEEAADSPNSFNNKSVYARMAVVFAGPLFNFVLAFLLSLIIVGFAGVDKPIISGVEAGQPMQEAGFQEGDVIKKIGGQSIVINREISTHFQFHKMDGTPVDITVERDGEKITKTVTPKIVKLESGKEAYQLGFKYSQLREKVGFWNTIKYSAYELKYWIWTTVESLGELIRGKVSKDDIAGPVGIVALVGDSIDQAKEVEINPYAISPVLLTILNISVLLTANLGVMNLLPIPALDGGRLLLFIVEWIRRKPNNQKVESVINFAGFAALMLLMVFIVFNDIAKLIVK